MIKIRLFIILAVMMVGLSCHAQLPIQQRFEELTAKAWSFSQQKEFAKSNECYEQLVGEMQGTEIESLIPSLREMIALNHLNIGIGLIKEKDYATAKTHLDNALKDAKEGSKVWVSLHSWIGTWNSQQCTDIRTGHGDLEQALAFSQEAAKYYAMAQKQDKVMKEHLTCATILMDLARLEEAEQVLLSVIAACKEKTELSLLLGRAYGRLGEIERTTERFNDAISHLEQSYDICLSSFHGGTSNAKTYARSAAQQMTILYTRMIPDETKATFWQKRYEELTD